MSNTDSKFINMILQNIRRMGSIIQNKSYNRNEVENINLDIVGILKRLKSNEYKDADFIQRNIFDVPRRTREFDNYLEGYRLQANVWAAILSCLPISEVNTILDLCPGWAPKIELALYELKYDKKVIIFDLDIDSCKQINNFMKLFHINYNLMIKKGNFFSSHKPKADLVLANHIIDDLLLYEFSGRKGIPLKTIYESEENLQSAATYILKNINFNQFILKVAVNIDQCVNKYGFLIMTQYSGLIENVLGLKKWSNLCQKLLWNVKDKLLDKNYNDQKILIHTAFTKISKKYFTEKQVILLKK